MPLSTKSKKELPHSVWTNPVHFIACGFGIGAIPFAPGTFGTLASIPFYLLIAKLPLWSYLLIVVLANIAGVYLCGKTNKDFGTTDHPAAVWDELATFPIVMITIPPSWLTITIGFILFRIFDIWKPGPVGWADKKVHGGIGVMLDDIIAAIISLIILKILTFFL